VVILLNAKNHTTQNKTTYTDTLNLNNTVFSIWIAFNFQKPITWYFFVSVLSMKIYKISMNTKNQSYHKGRNVIYILEKKMRTIATHHRRQSNPRNSTHLAKIQYWCVQMILEQWRSNSILVRTNQLQNLFYKFNFTIFIYNSSTNKICMHGTESRFHSGLQLLFRATFALFWMQFITVGQSKNFGNCLDLHYQGMINPSTPLTKAEAVFETVETHRIVQ